MPRNLIIYLSLAVLAHISTAQLSILAPKNLAAKFSSDIFSSFNHVGDIPYGGRMLGSLALANPIDACKAIESFADGQGRLYTNIIAVMERGHCRIFEKIRNAQLAGAKAVIIVDNGFGDLGKWFGHEHRVDDIRIPSMMIEQQYGDILITFLRKQQQQMHLGNADVVVKFPESPVFDRAPVDLYYSADDTSIYTFLKDFRPYWEKNTSAISLIPHILTWKYNLCDDVYCLKDTHPDCFTHGGYCALDPDGNGPLTGANVVFEGLKQICIFKHNAKLWYDYMIAFGDKYKEKQSISFVLDRDLLQSLADEESVRSIYSCVGNKSNSDFVVFKEEENQHLVTEKETQMEYNIHETRALFINYKTYYGDILDTAKVLKELCGSMANPFSECQSMPRNISERRAISYFEVVAVVTAITAAMIFLCKRKSKGGSNNMVPVVHRNMRSLELIEPIKIGTREAQTFSNSYQQADGFCPNIFQGIPYQQL